MSEFSDKLAAVRLNPNLMMNVALNELEAQLNGKGSFDVPSANSPFIYAMEATSMEASLAMGENHALLRMQYPTMALTTEELYMHMSDDAYIGRFATPAFTTFELYIDRDEVISKVVPVGDTGVSKLVIPRLTQFTCAGYSFTMQYPVELRLLQHGGLQVVYDGSAPSPLQTLESNQVPVREITSRGVNMLMLKLDTYQFKVDTYTETLNATAVFDQSYDFVNQFYYARVYISDKTQASGWREINTTHSDLVYNPLKLTAVLKVTNTTLRVSIPVIYNTVGMLDGELRLDLYTCNGAIDVDLGSYSDVTMVLNSLDDDTTYTSPLNSFNRFQALNPNRVTGGSNPIDFIELRDQVIDGVVGGNSLPITNAQITAALKAKGYGLVSNVDNITNRQFLATRRLANPVDANVIAGAGCLMGLMQTTMSEIAGSSHVRDNGDRITILPSMLYQYTAGKVQMLPDQAIAKLVGSSAETIARNTVDNRYLYSPFHYVLDASDSNFDVRPYYLDQPSITRKQYVDSNPSSQLDAGVDSYTIERITNGYRITVKLKSSDAFKQVDDELVVVQLGYQPIGETRWASVNGALIGTDEKERVYQFDLLTHFDISQEGGLYTTNLSMFDVAQVHYSLMLEHDLAVTICINDSVTPGYEATELDLLVQGHLLNANFMVVNRELLSVVFGYDMTDLWRRTRTILSAASYQTWDADVPYVYEETVFKRDANGQVIISINPDKSIKYEVLHQAGSPVLDSKGQPTFRYLKGDVKLDPDGRPILKEARKVLREFNLLMIDGLYYFATESNSVKYRNSIPLEIYGWINSDIAAIRAQLLERCELYVYPTATFGDTTALVREGLSSSIAIDQSLNITYYMPEKSYTQSSLRPPITKSTKALVNAQLANTTIAVSDLVSLLKSNGGEDIVSVEVEGLGGSNNYPIMTLQDPAVKLSLRKKLTVLANNDLMVEDDININYLKHKQLA